MPKEINLNTKNVNTWCPGCTNFLIKESFSKVVSEIIGETKGKLGSKDFVMITDIGCNAKIYDYLGLCGFNTIHGRVLPTMFGIKIGNPNLKVIGFGGDGGTYAEGVSHFIHACRNNPDITMLVFNNQVFALTVGQATPTTESGFREKTNPKGTFEKPLNPITLALVSGASFVARLSALDIEFSKNIIKQAIEHKGFSFIDILQPCMKFHDVSDFLRKNCYKIKPMKFEQALEKAQEWDYEYTNDKDKKIPVGIFYKEAREIFEEKREILAKLMKENKAFWQLPKLQGGKAIAADDFLNV